ncbi:zinc ribbon domain-containing protein [Staphylococcus simulans]|uniref:zinc ribbon domain-containing protein n=1 Tax=Staphylococcus simulans TaxID=1286 RepID=UPI0021D2F642|nr:zinc ribbon domain-containing protein [Staphylococcus simulans]UXR44737.1 zinc ribbon domain-containing protein [Staphylococcus simulans]
MKCSKCGTEVDQHTKFCPECGSPIESTQREPQFGTNTTPSFGAQDTPSFGAQDIPSFRTESSEEKKKNNTSASNSNTQNFGANSEQEAPKTTFINSAKGVLSRIIKLQTKEFWVKYYIISFIIMAFYFMINAGDGLGFIFLILNFILYPITETILQEGTKLVGINYIGNSLFESPDVHPYVKLFLFFVKILYKFFLWSFSWIVGPIGALYMNHLGKKMGL